VQLKLPGNPVRLGFSWDQDRAASSMVMLTRVVPGSAAAQAGLAPRDRVYQVDGREFANGQEFGRLVTSATGPVSLLVERQGVLHTFTVRPLDLVAADEPLAPDVNDTAAQQPPGTE
jgi:S1-C subfamily serine protease